MNIEKIQIEDKVDILSKKFQKLIESNKEKDNKISSYAKEVQNLKLKIDQLQTLINKYQENFNYEIEKINFLIKSKENKVNSETQSLFQTFPTDKGNLFRSNLPGSSSLFGWA